MGIDVRCANGYICLEPTILADGSKYGWLDWDVLQDDLPPIAPSPEWVITEQAQRTSRTTVKRDTKLPTVDFKAQLNEPLKARLKAFLEKSDLVKSAAEAILSKRWLDFKSGDLTRDATGWRSANNAHKTAAIDLLIDLGWIVDITTSDFGRRGRPAQGSFLVNESVHKKFAPHAERIADERRERYAAIQRAAHSRERELVESQRE